jgi:hypothetical protein
MKPTIKFQCPFKECGGWIITTLEAVCNLEGFYCSFCKKKIHPSMVFGGRFGTGTLDYEKEFMAYIGSYVVELDDMARENTRLVRSGQISLMKAQVRMWEGVEKVFRLVRIFKGYNYESADRTGYEDSSLNHTAYKESCYCGGA